jgi:hypothetical protein
MTTPALIDPPAEALAAAESCYPEGVPADFPAVLFAPIDPALPQERRDLLLRDRVEDIEQVLLTLPQAEVPVEHFFSGDGVYGRQILIRKGTLLTGKIHLFEHLNVVSYGDVTMMTVDGPKRLKGPCTLVSAPGSKKFGYANEDTLWMTLHATRETDVAKIERMLTVDTFADYERYLTALPGPVIDLLETQP